MATRAHRTPLGIAAIGALSLVAMGCRSAGDEAPDTRQMATCTVFLPDGNVEQPSCWLDAGDLVADGNGQLLVTVAGSGDLGAPGRSAAWDVRIRGPLHTGVFGFAALSPSTLALFTIEGDQDYALSPAYMQQSFGSVEVRLMRVDPLPATIGPRVISVVGGSADLSFAGLSDPKRTVVARVSF